MDVSPGFKKTELGVIPTDWDLKPLGELVSFYQPVTISAKELTEAGYPVYGANGVVGFYHSANHHSWQVTVTCRGSTCGTVNRTVDECWITGNAMVANCDHNKGINKDFFYFLMLGQDFSECITGTGQPQIVRSPLAAFRVAFPRELAEQRAIAEALSDVDAMLGALDRLIAKKRDLKQAAMQQLLTGQTRLPGFHGEWGVKRLGDLGGTYGGLTGKTKGDFGEGAARYITFMNVMTNIVIDTGMFEQVRVSRQESQNRALKDDLFFNGSSETPEEVALCAVLTEEVQDVYLNSFCFGFRFRDGAEADGLFLAYYFRSAQGRELMKSLAQGSTRYNLSKSALLKSPLRLPPQLEQIAIAQVLADMDAELAGLNQRNIKTRALKQAMMHELLTGRTRLV